MKQYVSIKIQIGKQEPRWRWAIKKAIPNSGGKSSYKLATKKGGLANGLFTIKKIFDERPAKIGADGLLEVIGNDVTCERCAKTSALVKELASAWGPELAGLQVSARIYRTTAAEVLATFLVEIGFSKEEKT